MDLFMPEGGYVHVFLTTWHHVWGVLMHLRISLVQSKLYANIFIRFIKNLNEEKMNIFVLKIITTH